MGSSGFSWAGITLYVDDDVEPSGNGLSWASPMKYLQDALAIASIPAMNVSEIHVAQGEYRPDQSNVNPAGTLSKSATFSIPAGILVRGGFAGLGTANPDIQNFEDFVSVLNGDLLGDDGPGFANKADNSTRVATLNGAEGTTLQGFAVTGSGLSMTGAALVEYCSITAAQAQDGGGVHCSNGGVLRHCTISGNDAINRGGGVYCKGSATALFEDCVFKENTASIGGGLAIHESGTAIIKGCSFFDNSGSAFGGACTAAYYGDEPAPSLYLFESLLAGNTSLSGAGLYLGMKASSTFQVRGCQFEDNDAAVGGGFFSFEELDQTLGRIVSCAFCGNQAPISGGAGVVVSRTSIANSAMNLNTSNEGTVTVSQHSSSIKNSTISGASKTSIHAGAKVTIYNSIIWGSQTPTIKNVSGGPLDIQFCNVKGGATGLGNIDQDPLFILPSSNALGLAEGSPCIDAGLTALVPEDSLDLDNDGDTSEPLPFDLAGGPRAVGTAVDMGAYEGVFEPIPPMDSASIPKGESEVLIPQGGEWSPEEAASVIAKNVTGGPTETVEVIEKSWTSHPDAGGFSELGITLTVNTSLQPGEGTYKVYIPIDKKIAGIVDPAALDLTRFDASTGDWILAVAANKTASPDYPGPVGDRIVKINDVDDWGISNQLGDYGLYWNPTLKTGFVWANVDVAADFAVGAPLCFADCAPANGDGLVDESDLSALLAAWGLEDVESSGGVFDLDADGVVAGADLGLLLSAWGGCGGSGEGGVADGEPSWTPAEWPTAVPNDPRDLDGDGVINGRDLGRLIASWGVAPAGQRRGAVPADFNHDGRVDREDLLTLLGKPGGN